MGNGLCTRIIFYAEEWHKKSDDQKQKRRKTSKINKRLLKVEVVICAGIGVGEMKMNGVKTGTEAHNY